MSEPGVQDGLAAIAGPPAAHDGVTAGTLLRRAREAAGLHVAALAVSLKVPVRKLEALEQDRWDQLTDAVFVRALASSVCRTLKIDARPVLDRLPQTAAPQLSKLGEGINATFRAPGEGAAPGLLDQLTRPVFLVVFALLLGALVLILLPTVQQGEIVAAGGSGVAAPQPAGAPASATVMAPAPTAGLPAASPAQPAEAPGAAAAPQAAQAPATVALVAGAAAPAAAAPAVAPEPGGDDDAPAAIASGIIVFRTKNPSWVEVTDAKGVVAVRRVMGAGEAEGVSGALPLQVVIGRVDAIEVQVRGKPFDLRPVSRDNVARFQVK